MRDSQHLKEKYELTLDSRQIVTLTVALLVVLGGAFVLGVAVGKKLMAEQSGATSAAPHDILAAVDQKTAALEDAQKDASLTFHESLMQPTVPVVAEAPVRAPLPVVEAPAAKPAAPEVAAAPVGDPVKVDTVPTRLSDAGALKEAFGRVQARPEGAAANGNWTLQLSASQDEDEADRFAAGLRDKGYAPYIIEATVAGKGTWFRVRMGRFADKDAATRYLTDFQRETSLEAFVAPVK